MKRLLPLTALSLALVAASGCGDDSTSGSGTSTAPPAPPTAPQGLNLAVVTQRADMISGGDVLLAFDLPEGADTSEVEVQANGTTVEPSFRSLRDGSQGVLVEGLPEGNNVLQLSVGETHQQLSVTNYPVTGPIFSGHHLPLPVCSTDAHGLGPAVDANCSAPTQIRYRYYDADGESHVLNDPSSLPSDVMLVDGTDLPFVVREEVGTINRAIYWITVLDPSPGESDWDASHWNGRLVYQFGGGCGTTYTQGFRLQGAPSPSALASGYAFATATFNTMQVMCNDVLSAETVLMVKERFTERYGVPELTIGHGGSGGAIQQYLIGQNYPGLLDALSPTVPFADVLTTALGVLDCSLLLNFYEAAGADWTVEQQTAVNGHLTAGTCGFWDLTFTPGIRATEGCAIGVAGALPGIPALPPIDPGLLYDPIENPDGLRCTVQDTNINVVGVDPETGLARRAWDNIGVQYGLAALNDGMISVDQFLDLNETIGGYDEDGFIHEIRTAATEETVRLAYETGRVVTGQSNLREIPIITTDIWTDDQADIHDRVRAFGLRERLRLDDGSNAPGFMIWTTDPAGAALIDSFAGGANAGVSPVGVLDDWLTAMQGTDRTDFVTHLESTRPEAAIDNCITADGDHFSGLDIYENPGPCTDPYPISAGPRMVSGGPVSEHVLKCSRMSVSDATTAGIYAVEFTDAQRARLEAVFPDGVCDYNVPGIGEAPLQGTWLRY
ncbi:MAG: DUF6351 family protein [Candidatus Binatia bacterium]|nr:DUF6351 family protein [Candidatus Binatia bacterium]